MAGCPRQAPVASHPPPPLSDCEVLTSVLTTSVTDSELLVSVLLASELLVSVLLASVLLVSELLASVLLASVLLASVLLVSLPERIMAMSAHALKVST